jgi:hypothetical protein
VESNQEDKGGTQVVLEPDQEVQYDESVTDWIE